MSESSNEYPTTVDEGEDEVKIEEVVKEHNLEEANAIPNKPKSQKEEEPSKVDHKKPQPHKEEEPSKFDPKKCRKIVPCKFRKKPSYVWRPEPPLPRPSYSPCPHIYFRNIAIKNAKQGVDKKDESRKCIAEQEPDMKKHKRRTRTGPTGETLLRYKRLPITSRIVQLALPKLMYVKAHWEEFARILTPAMSERLKVIMDEFEMIPENPPRKHKRRRRARSQGKRRASTAEEREEFVRCLVMEVADEAIDVADRPPVRNRIQDMAATVLLRLAEAVGETGPSPEATQYLAKMMLMAAERVATWIDGVTSPDEIAHLGLKEPRAEGECWACDVPSRRKRRMKRRPKARKKAKKADKEECGKEEKKKEPVCYCACNCEETMRKRRMKRKKKGKKSKDSKDSGEGGDGGDNADGEEGDGGVDDKVIGGGTGEDGGPGGESGGPDGGEKTPGSQSPGKQTPGKQSPGKQSPGKQSPGKQSPGKDSPGKQSSGKESPEKSEGSSPAKSSQKSPSKPPSERSPAKSEGSKSPAKSPEKSPAKSPAKSPGQKSTDKSEKSEKSDKSRSSSKASDQKSTASKSPKSGGRSTDESGSGRRSTVEEAERRKREAEEKARKSEEQALLDGQISDMGDRIADEAIREGVKDAEGKDVTFGTILEQLSQMIEEAPESVETERRKKLTKTLEKKFTRMIEAESQAKLEPDTRQTVQSVSSKIANWMERVMSEADQRMGSLDTTGAMPQEGGPCGTTCLGQPMKKASPVTTTAVKEWAEWIVGAMYVADDWAAWISRTVAEAEKKAEKKKGRPRTADGEDAKLTRREYVEWKENLKKEAIEYRMKKKQLGEQAADWRKKTKGRPIKIGEATTSKVEEVEVEEKVTDLETRDKNRK